MEGIDDKCVRCEQILTEPTWQPFCSERCKILDLQNWMTERYRLPGTFVASIPENDETTD